MKMCLMVWKNFMGGVCVEVVVNGLWRVVEDWNFCD